MPLTEGKIDWYWYCSKCGIDTPYLKGYPRHKGYDAYYTQYDEMEAQEELNIFFDSKYPQYQRR